MIEAKELNKNETIRLELEYESYNYLLKVINDIKNEEIEEFDRYSYDELVKSFQNVKQFETDNKKIGIRKARDAKEKQTKAKIQNAINLLRLEGKEFTPYHVAKTANISFNTAKKYLQ